MAWKHLYAYPETVPRFFVAQARKNFRSQDETLNYLMDLSELKFKIYKGEITDEVELLILPERIKNGWIVRSLDLKHLTKIAK